MTKQDFFEAPAVQLVLRRMTNANVRRIDSNQVAGNAILRKVAYYYISCYQGSFDFMRDLHMRWQRGAEIDEYTDRQLAAAINSMYTEHTQLATKARIVAERQPTIEINLAAIPMTKAADVAPTSPREVVPASPAIPNGTYTVMLPSGDYRTLKLDDAPETFNKAPGTQIASFLSGPDNSTNFTGFAFVNGQGYTLWGRFLANSDQSAIREALQGLLFGSIDGARAAGEAYALQSGRCWVCGRKLTVPASLHAGMGPICAGRINAEYGGVHDSDVTSLAPAPASPDVKSAAKKSYKQLVIDADDLFS